MNQINFTDNVSNNIVWSVLILEPEELREIALGRPAMIDIDPDNNDIPSISIACEEDSDRLREVLDTGDSEKVMKYLRREQAELPDAVTGRTRQDYERATKQPPAREKMTRSTVIPAESINIAPGSPVGVDDPDRVFISLAVDGCATEVCYELNNMAKADKLISLLIAARNRLWPHGRIS